MATREFQSGAIYSLSETPNARSQQMGAVVSITEMPVPRAQQMAIIFSVSPDLPKRYGAYSLGGGAVGAMNLLVDMNANSKR